MEKAIDVSIITPGPFSSWTARIVPIMKKDSVRIHGDFKVTVNQPCQVDSNPLPRVEQFFSVSSGGKYFSKLDMP